MRPDQIVRTLVKAGGVAILWLLTFSSVSHAAPGPFKALDRLVCDAQSQALRKLLRHPKSYGGPVTTKQRRSRLGLRFDLTDHLHRAKRTPVGNDAAAIQNDAPAARIVSDDQSLPSLQSLGFLAGPVDSHPRTRDFSPRSPRGPPAAV
jgi:hypothetical protein